LSPRADQIRCTVAGLTPNSRAIDRQLQCVSPRGLQFRVLSTMASTVSSEIVGLRPRPERTIPNRAKPRSAKSLRHARTVVGEAPTCCAIESFAIPSAASNNARARRTCRTAVVCDRANACRVDRCPSDSTSGAAG
jgi:hypothetical protein